MKRITFIFLISISILLIPLVAMQFTDDIDWSLLDFAMAGMLLLGTGILLEWVLRSVKKRKYRILLIVLLALLLILVWAELAVGILGTPFGGS